MSLNTKVILSFLAGAFSAALAWVIIDFNGFYRLSDHLIAKSSGEMYVELAFVGAVFGLFVGLGIGTVNGLSASSSKLMRRNAAYGAGIGIVGGLLGLYFGQMVFGALYRAPEQALPFGVLSPAFFVWRIVVRAVGWALIGLFVGMAQGLPSHSKKAARHGAIGGCIGGFIGGMLFEIVPYLVGPVVQNPGVISRGISLTVTGAAIGLFIGLVENMMKQAWVRVVEGRNEGREYIITKDRTTIGRDELSDIGLFGDRNVSPLHAVIEAQGGRHILRDNSSSLGTAVRGQKIAECVLRDGDVIEIGAMRLEFHEKATASRVPQIRDVASKPLPKIPTSDKMCPFCGGFKDPKTGTCECSVVGSAAPAYAPQPQAAPTGNGYRLTGIGGAYAGQTFALSPTGATSIGREQGRDIQLSMDTTISRKHARIVNEGGSFVVYDEGSSNGTSVNGARITRQQIAPGDTIDFGSSRFRFEA